MQPFPILNLPSVALGEFLKCFNPIELIELSQSSKKVSKLIKICGTQNFELSLDVAGRSITIGTHGEFYKIHILENTSNKIRVTRTKRIRTDDFMKLVLADKKKKEMELFWDDSTKWIDLCFHIANVFNCPITYFETGRKLSTDDFHLIINLIIDRQSEIRSLSISLKELDDDDVKKTLDRLKVTRDFSIDIKLTPQFQYKFIHEPRMISIFYSSWFTLGNLLATNCVFIELSQASLTNQDLDVYLGKWKAGDYPKLEYLTIRSEKFCDKTPIDGVQPPIKGQDETKKVSKFIGNFRNVGISGGVEIQRNDGTIGTMKMGERSGMLSFSFLVSN